MKNKIRNKPCECGSGKKTKKCLPFHKNPYGINTPKSVEEFRKNLGKYFWTKGDEGKKIYVQFSNGKSDFYDIDKISSFDDIYELDNRGPDYGYQFPPSICPKMDFVKDKQEFMNQTNQTFSFNGYFLDEKNYNLVECQWDGKDPSWSNLNNQIMREFFDCLD